MATKILLLEDDKLFNETLQDFLEEEEAYETYIIRLYHHQKTLPKYFFNDNFTSDLITEGVGYEFKDLTYWKDIHKKWLERIRMIRYEGWEGYIKLEKLYL